MSRRSTTTPSTNFPIEKKDFRFTVRNVRQLTTYSSSRVYLNGVPWQVKLKKIGDNVTIELCCNYANSTPNWSCAARTVIKLLSFATNAEMYEKRQDTVAVFSSELPSIGRHQELIKWNDLFDSKRQHVCNNAIVVDVSIQAETLRNETQSRLIEIERTYGRATLRFKSAKVKGVIAMDSPKFMFGNVMCKLTFSKRYPLTKKELEEDKYGYLGIWLVGDVADISKYSVQVIFRLLSHKIGGKHVEKLADRTTNNRFNFSSRLIPLHELYESRHEYIQNDSLTLEVDITSQHIGDHASTKMNNNNGNATNIQMECILCYDNMIDRPVSSTPCGHLFCKKCIINALKVRSSCPICNKHVLVKDVHDVFLPSIHQSE